MPSVGLETAIPAVAELRFGMHENRDRLIYFPLDKYDLSVQLLSIFSIYWQELLNSPSR
jgi:hypothetical protein